MKAGYHIVIPGRKYPIIIIGPAVSFNEYDMVCINLTNGIGDVICRQAQAGKVELWLPSYERPNTWLPDIRPKLEPVFVAPMGRVLDVAGIGGMSVGPGSFTARISDPHCPWNDRIWTVIGEGGTLAITPGQEADCNLTIQGLSALVYGVNDPGDFYVRGWGDPSAELQDVMRTMFPLKYPYLHEYY